MYEGYGTTEAGPIATDSWIHSNVGVYFCVVPKHIVLLILYNTEVRLEDVPDLGYLTTDKPHPRGEIWVRTNILITEYSVCLFSVSRERY